jgi:hypothetical protein
LEYYTPDRPKESSFFGIHQKTVNNTVSENFYPGDISLKGLDHILEYSKDYFTKKKETKLYEEFRNFHILDKRYLSKEEFKNLKIKYNHSYLYSNYSYNYWENPDFPALPSFITSILNKDLIFIEK